MTSTDDSVPTTAAKFVVRAAFALGLFIGLVAGLILGAAYL